MERRRSTRIPFKASAYLVQDGIPVPSQTLDISRRGIFISTQSRYREGDSAVVSILFKDDRHTLSLTLNCSVTRVSPSGIGCSSPHLDPETLLFMSNLIHSRMVPSPQFMQCFYAYLEGF